MAKEKVTTVDPVEEVNNLVSKALVALDKFKEIECQEKIDKIVHAAAVAALAQQMSTWVKEGKVFFSKQEKK